MNWTYEHFEHCPKCGGRVEPPPVNRPLRCAGCGFTLFFNPATAVGAFVFRPDGRSLWLRRAKPPGQGKLGLAGGFVDMGETAEAALVRELREEVGLEAADARFLCSVPNEYEYAGVRYPVCDLFFRVEVRDHDVRAAQAAEVAGWVWLPLAEVDPARIAFVSVRRAFAQLSGQG